MLFCASPLYVLWTGWRPVPLIVASSALMTLSVPLVTILLLRIASDRNRLGRYANGRLATAAMWVLIAASLLVTYQGAVELLGPR